MQELVEFLLNTVEDRELPDLEVEESPLPHELGDIYEELFVFQEPENIIKLESLGIVQVYLFHELYDVFEIALV